MEDAYAKDVSEVLHYFQVDANRGLSDDQVAKNTLEYGRNGTPFWKLVLKQFDDLLVKILILAAVVSFLLALANGESGFTAFLEPSVILMILAANAAVGVITETNAEKAIEELKAYQADVATVLRNGRLSMVPSADLVPGDVVEIAVGCKVPADLRLVQILSSQLRVDQSILTGESGSVSKSLDATSSLKAVYQDKVNLLFSGTVVTVGRGRAVVVGSGSRTAIGKIHDAMSESVNEMTPLKRKLDEFGTFLSKVIAVVCVLVWVVNISHFRDPAHGGMLRGAIYYFKIAVALAVAAIPEGLPAVVTTCLALGTKKMAKLNAIVRTLPSVETLGCTTVICSDKTGTLTTNMMSVSKMCVLTTGSGQPGIEEFSVSGTTYAPEGLVFRSNNTPVEHPADMPAIRQLATCAALCNDACVQYNAEKGTYDNMGEATELALRVLAEKVGLPEFDAMPGSLKQLSKAERACFCSHYWEQQFHKVATLEFTRDRKMMSVHCSHTPGRQQALFSKGAPESILSRCTHALSNSDGSVQALTPNSRSDILEVFTSYGQKQTLRCLALAMRVMPEDHGSVSTADECDLIFLGLVGMLDPPRPEVRAAIETCRAAGIRATAEAVCRQIGALDAVGPTTGKSYTASEFDELSLSQQASTARHLVLLSRVEPSHKSKLVELLQRQNEVVAMTGDGVNDAPALKRANIGIAMGSGTAVAKGASDMVLADDNFSTIVAAVAEGRAIYNNTKQFIRYMVSSNIGEVVCIFVAAALGMPETLIPVQLLWVNLVTDGLPATALGFNKQDRNVMTVRPRKMDEAIVNGWLFFRYLVVGCYVGLVTVGGFGWWYMLYQEGPKMAWSQLVGFDSCVEGQQQYACAVFGDRRPKTVSMSVLVVVEMFNALNNLSENQSLLVLPPWSNPWLLAAIGVAPLSLAEWQAVVYLSFPVILVDEAMKLLSRHLGVGGGSSSSGWRFWRRRNKDMLPRTVKQDQ
eukprot:jgi/Mesen1/8601/ME000005S08568